MIWVIQILSKKSPEIYQLITGFKLSLVLRAVHAGNLCFVTSFCYFPSVEYSHPKKTILRNFFLVSNVKYFNCSLPPEYQYTGSQTLTHNLDATNPYIGNIGEEKRSGKYFSIKLLLITTDDKVLNEYKNSNYVVVC